MSTSSIQAESEFDGQFHSHGGPQFLGNRFNTNGAPIYLDSSSDNREPASVCELPDYILSSYFTGRDDELQQIDCAFSTPCGELPARCVIYGMPGVGKTQLALKFATWGSQRNHYTYIFWVSAASDEKLTRDFSKLVDLLRLPGRHGLDQATKLTVARAWLEDSSVARSWLLVLDNATRETTMTLRDVLPRRNSKGRLLFTTRTATMAELITTPGESSKVALQPLRMNDAVAMLSIGAKMDRGSREEAGRVDMERLVRCVGCLPLAIDQAASYIRETGSSPEEILGIYKSGEVMEILSWENDLSCYEEKSVVAMFTPAVNKIQGAAPDALTLLRVLCFCDPERIPISILKEGCGALRQEDPRRTPPARAVDKLESAIDLFRSQTRLSKAVQEIQRLSLVTHTVEGSDRIVRIHDLVHLLLRSKLIADAERGQWLETVIRIVCKALEGVGDHKSPHNRSRCGQFISHIEFLEGFAERYRLENTKLLDASTWCAMYFSGCGLYHKAASMNQRTWVQKKTLLGEDHPSTLTSMANLAWTYWRQGRWKEAERLNVRVIKIKKTMLGEEHPDTLNSMANLASIYSVQGRWKEAEELQMSVIETMKRVLGEEHPDTLISMVNLASTYRNQGRWKEAEELQVLVLKAEKTMLGEKHPDTLNSMVNLASTYSVQGRWKEAEELQMSVIETMKRVLGEEHPSTLTSINNLAFTWKRQGQNAKAINLMGECVHLRTRILGANHPKTLSSSATFTEWQIQEPEVSSSAINDLTSTG